MNYLAQIDETKLNNLKIQFELSESELNLLIKLNYRYHTKMSAFNLVN